MNALLKNVVLLTLVPLILFSCGRRAHRIPASSEYPEPVGMNEDSLALIEGVVKEAIACGTIPGAVVAVVSGDRLAYLEAFGNRSVIPDTVHMTTSTVFDLASLSKCVGTTLSFLQLVEKGLVALNDKVSDYIPGFAAWKDPETGEKVDITVLHLMTHSSGLDPVIDVPRYISRYGTASPDSLRRYLAGEVGRNFRPGTEYLYSCVNFITLQCILEQVTGKRLCDYAMENIFKPLGLENTCYNPVEQPEILQYVAPTELQPDGKPLLGLVHDPTARIINGGNSGNAGIFSNAEDLATIAAMIMNGGSLRGKKILERETIEKMIAVPEEIDQSVGRALGWDNRSRSSSPKGHHFSESKTICHTGYTGTSMVLDMESRIAIIILSNRVHPYDKGSVVRMRSRIADIVASAQEQ